jgi:uncharacterized protein YchJ
MRKLIGMMLPFALMMESVSATTILKDEKPNKGDGGKIRKGHSFKRIYSGDTPYIKEEVVGRNEPCSCGSGKKYKKCCQQ